MKSFKNLLKCAFIAAQSITLCSCSSDDDEPIYNDPEYIITSDLTADDVCGDWILTSVKPSNGEEIIFNLQVSISNPQTAIQSDGTQICTYDVSTAVEDDNMTIGCSVLNGKVLSVALDYGFTIREDDQPTVSGVIIGNAVGKQNISKNAITFTGDCKLTPFGEIPDMNPNPCTYYLQRR